MIKIYILQNATNNILKVSLLKSGVKDYADRFLIHHNLCKLKVTVWSLLEKVDEYIY